MQVSVESGEGLERRLLVDLPKEQVETEVEKKLTELAKNIRLDGFRPGKVPVRVVRQRFGDQVRQEVYGDLIQATFYEAAEQSNVAPVGDPSIELRDAAEEGGLSYTATFQVMPEIELADLSGKEVVKPVAEVTEADVDEMIDKLRRQRQSWEEVDRAAQDGDTVHIDFKGFIDGEAFEGGTAEDVPLVLGSGSMIDGFESGLLGAKAGETRTVEVTFPEDYRAEHLAGKPASFEITVRKVLEARLPEIDEQFVKDFGVEEGTEEALRAEVRKNMETELAQKLSGLAKDNVMALLREANPVEVPDAMVKQEAERMKQQAMADMQARGQQSSLDLPASLFEGQARVRVHLGLLVGEIIDKQGLEASEDDVRQMIEQLAQSYEDPQEVVDYYLNNPQQRASLENLVLENKVVDWVLEQVEVKEDKRTFSEVMNPEQQAQN
ncbi:trigger factor [endosymbiont of unidentified scaly snail isolate Monju]|uniref:trigger factor n=1 Tax=endosymbiont of unidentified scaly snail isolate Monju TaxID=1248727 RepID=UPI0003891DAD|nr:trigger factor [endosymbiont of unidentified scaly snail isolate Monju]BAN69287.1 trigger factor [endosymbiont of unidentified scaly snail isolate Monju]